MFECQPFFTPAPRAETSTFQLTVSIACEKRLGCRAFCGMWTNAHRWKLKKKWMSREDISGCKKRVTNLKWRYFGIVTPTNHHSNPHNLSRFMIHGDMNIKLPNQLTIPANRAAASNSRASNGPTKWCKTKHNRGCCGIRGICSTLANGTAFSSKWYCTRYCWCSNCSNGSNSMKFTQTPGLSMKLMGIQCSHFLAAPSHGCFTRAPALPAEIVRGKLCVLEKTVFWHDAANSGKYGSIMVHNG